MASHKSKSDVTLFELVGKSTLKVPKNAGALKIPHWWSSKTNPPTVTVAGQTVPPTGDEDLAEAPAAQETPAEPAAHQPEPETASSGQSVPSSDRLSHIPVRTPAVRPAAKAPAAPLKYSAPRPAPVVRQTGGIFAPQSFDPGRLVRRNTAMPQIPVFAIVAGALFVCLVVLVGILVFRRSGSSAPQAPSPVTVGLQNPVAQAPAHSPLPNTPPGRMVAPTAPPAGQSPAPAPQAPAPTLNIIPGHVIPAAQVKREANLWYLVICSAPSDHIATANAQFLVEHGMSDLTVEQKANGMFSVTSVQGFAKVSDPNADALRKLAIEIGQQHPDAKRQKRAVYGDAYYMKIKRAN